MDRPTNLDQTMTAAASRCGLFALVCSIAVVATTVMGFVVLLAVFTRSSSPSLGQLLLMLMAALVLNGAPGLVLLHSGLALRAHATDPELLITGIWKLRTYFAVVAVMTGIFLLLSVGGAVVGIARHLL